jgi:choline-sulfatase
VRAARHAYYAMVSYVDDKVGRLLETLRTCGFGNDTVVVFTADHGEMLGERGMFYKQSFFEPSVRVPLLVHAPRQFAPRRVSAPVSLVDLLPTFIDLAGSDVAWPEPKDGTSLLPWLAGGAAAPRPVISEYTDMGVLAPCRMVRDGRWKYIYTHGHPAQLFDLDADPRELQDRAGDAELADVAARLEDAVLDGWDADALHRDVLASQRRRLFIRQASAAAGSAHDWSYQATRDDRRRFVRAGGAAGAKARARFPFVP